MNKNWKIIRTIIISFIILSLIASYIGINLFFPVQEKDIEVEIKEGLTYKEAIDIFLKKDLILEKNVFIVYGRITGLDKRLQAGFYFFTSGSRPKDILSKLEKREVVKFRVTITEGDNILQIGNKLEILGLMPQERLISLSKDKIFLKELDINSPNLEGYLFPQTYNLPKGIHSDLIVKKMVAEFKKNYNEELQTRAKQIGWTENEVLTLASIIEKEAVIDEERTIISSVYHNRIKIGMRLQSDPTTIYGIKKKNAVITKKDLKNKTSYNTYLHKGLPPGPIASPSIKSIKAALYPKKTDYLYFVSSNGEIHYFSKTFKEHLANIKKIRRNKNI